jgi:hypothetical protein
LVTSRKRASLGFLEPVNRWTLIVDGRDHIYVWHRADAQPWRGYLIRCSLPSRMSLFPSVLAFLVSISITMPGASILFAATVLAQAALAVPVARSGYAVKETHFVPQRWTQKGRAPKHQMLALQIGVKQGNFAQLERQLYEGSSQCQQY